MPETDIPSSNRARAKPQQESRQRVPSTDHDQTTAGPGAGTREMEYPGESLLDSGFSQGTFESHAALLGDSRLSRPANARVRIQIAQQLQRDYGNQYVQRLVKHISRQRTPVSQSKLATGQSDDKHGQQADRLTWPMVGTTPINQPPSDAKWRVPPSADLQGMLGAGTVDETVVRSRVRRLLDRMNREGRLRVAASVDIGVVMGEIFPRGLASWTRRRTTAT